MRIRTGLAALVVLAAVMPTAQAEGFGGFYSGITLGSHSQKLDWMTTDARYRDGTLVNPGANPDNTSTIEDGTSLPAFLSDPNVAGLKDSTYALGLVFGYNFELAPNFIVGLELSGGASATYDTIDDRIPGLGTTSYDPYTSATVRTSKPLAAGLRLGYVVAPNTLAYIRGNYERISVATKAFSSECPAANEDFGPGTNPVRTEPLVCPNDLRGKYSASDKLYAWGYGGGVEYLIGETVSVRLEYREAKFGKTKELNVMPESGSNFGADAVLDLKKSGMVELGVLVHF